MFTSKCFDSVDSRNAPHVYTYVIKQTENAPPSLKAFMIGEMFVIVTQSLVGKGVRRVRAALQSYLPSFEMSRVLLATPGCLTFP